MNMGIIDNNIGIDVLDGINSSNSELYLNGQPVVIGTYQTKIKFHVELNPANHTIFYLAKYRDGSYNKERILAANDGSSDTAIFGFCTLYICS